MSLLFEEKQFCNVRKHDFFSFMILFMYVSLFIVAEEIMVLTHFHGEILYTTNMNDLFGSPLRQFKKWLTWCYVYTPMKFFCFLMK